MSEDAGNTFEGLYLKERKKATIFMTSAIILAVLAAGLLVYVLSAPQGMRGQSDGMVRMRMGLDIKSFFNEDGSVDSAKVSEMTDRVPEGNKDRMLESMGSTIDSAVQDGEITSAQSTELKKAMGITA